MGTCYRYDTLSGYVLQVGYIIWVRVISRKHYMGICYRNVKKYIRNRKRLR